MNNNAAVSESDDSQERNRQRRQQWLKQTETRRAENNRAAFNRWMIHVDQGKVKYSTLQNYPTAGRRQAGKREGDEQLAAAALAATQAQALMQSVGSPSSLIGSPPRMTQQPPQQQQGCELLPHEYPAYPYPAVYPSYPPSYTMPTGQGGYCYSSAPPPNYITQNPHNVYVLQLGSGGSQPGEGSPNSASGYYGSPPEEGQGEQGSEPSYWSTENYPATTCLLQRQL